nr:hypothetical protein Iba_chr05dCG14690 [Ipomoea batatas]
MVEMEECGISFKSSITMNATTLFTNPPPLSSLLLPAFSAFTGNIKRLRTNSALTVRTNRLRVVGDGSPPPTKPVIAARTNVKLLGLGSAVGGHEEWHRFPREPTMELWFTSLITVPSGKHMRWNKKSTKGSSASAKTTFRAFLSTRSFKLITVDEAAAIVQRDRNEERVCKIKDWGQATAHNMTPDLLEDSWHKSL